MKSYYIDVHTWTPKNKKEESVCTAAERFERVVVIGDNAKEYIKNELKKIVDAANREYPRCRKELRLLSWLERYKNSIIYIQGYDTVVQVTLTEIDREISVQ